MSLENRIAELEKSGRRSRLVSIFLSLSIIVLGFAAAAPVNTPGDEVVKGSLVLVSPDGKNTITLKATDSIAGLWIGAKDTDSPQVSIYTNKQDGAVVGVFGDRHGRPTKGLDVAISANKGEAKIQGVDAKNNPVIKSIIEVVK